ncbi:MAG: hypothetical protein HYS23_07495 [Geobacter sp.]|nr:hypothetical protein [Geobacter sp.]
MLVFLSDIHLTDGTSGETIKSTAFRIFAESVKKLAGTVDPLREIRIVLLGDIFDVIRSTRWLDANVRPWNDANVNQQQVVSEIVNGILSSAENSSSIEHIKSIREAADARNVPFSIEYVIGNHDWLINRYPEAIQAVSDKLGTAAVTFPAEVYYEDYKAYACHGDKYDEFNHTGNRNASSIGDAIVIELLNRFPAEVEKKLNDPAEDWEISAKEKSRVIDLLKEIDNIRPLLDAPTWVLMVQEKVPSKKVQKMIDETWQKCVDNFLKLEFIKKFDKFLWPDLVDGLEFVLRLSSQASGRVREKVAETVKSLMSDTEGEKYLKRAYGEARLRSGAASYVLYGHTHDHKLIPLDQAPNNTLKPDDKIYFNTGTWRKTWNRTAFDRSSREFIGWHVLTYVALFRGDENGDYNFEVWNSALG